MSTDATHISIPDFLIKGQDTVCKAFTGSGIHSFHQAIHYVRHLPYGRNTDKNDLTTLFKDHCGTCSTKHALLKVLADEHQIEDLQLIIGLYKMNDNNTPRVAQTLAQYGLEYIPEAHCYLKYQGRIFDFTKANSKASDFENDLIEETAIEPHQISEYKIAYHKKYLQHWLNTEKPDVASLSALWHIREQCIKALS